MVRGITGLERHLYVAVGDMQQFNIMGFFRHCDSSNCVHFASISMRLHADPAYEPKQRHVMCGGRADASAHVWSMFRDHMCQRSPPSSQCQLRWPANCLVPHIVTSSPSDVDRFQALMSSISCYQGQRSCRSVIISRTGTDPRRRPCLRQ
jgi:hypothetical protein